MRDFPEELTRKLVPLRILGEGGMGRVFLARDPVFERKVAVKLTLPDAARDVEVLRTRFQREARILAGLDHPNLLALYDFGETRAGELFMVMQYVRGTSLKELLPVEDPLATLEPIGRALEHLHAAGVVHRDVKPANIMVEPEGKSVLVDLGLARSEDLETLTRTGAVAGTLPYIAPEVFRGEGAGPPADWWAWGVCLFRALEGRFPFSKVDMLAMVHGREPEVPPRFERVSPESRAARAARACLVTDPDRRPTSLEEVHRHLGEPDRPAPARPRDPAVREAQPGAPALPSREVAAPRPDEPPRRSPLATALVVAGLFLAGLGAGWAFRFGRGAPPLPEPPRIPEDAGGGDALPVAEVGVRERGVLDEVAREALRGHGVPVGAGIFLDPVAQDRGGVRRHLEGLGWIERLPDLGPTARVGSALAGWLRRLRDWEKETGGRAFADPAVREGLRVYGHGALLHLVRELRFLAEQPVTVLTAATIPAFREEWRALVGDLLHDLWIWPEDETPLAVAALRARLVAPLERDTSAIAPPLARLLPRLDASGEELAEVTSAILDLVDAAPSPESLPRSLRVRAFTRVYEALDRPRPGLGEETRAVLLRRLGDQEVRAASRGLDDPGAPARVRGIREALEASAPGPGLLEELRRGVRSGVEKDVALGRSGPEDQARVEELLGVLGVEGSHDAGGHAGGSR